MKVWWTNNICVKFQNVFFDKHSLLTLSERETFEK